MSDYRHGWIVSGDVTDARTGEPRHDGITHYDLKTGKSASWAGGADDRCGEPIFVPRHAEAAEGDGWLLTVVYRGAEARSDLAVFEATDIAGALWRLPISAARCRQASTATGGRARYSRVRYKGAMITVHHLENSRSLRIVWMLEELGLDYEIKPYKREPTLQAPASLRSVHPLGKSPIVTDGGRTLAESGAILEYLVETYGKGRFVPAAGSEEKLHYTYFLHYAEGSLMPLLFTKLVFNNLPSAYPG